MKNVSIGRGLTEYTKARCITRAPVYLARGSIVDADHSTLPAQATRTKRVRTNDNASATSDLWLSRPRRFHTRDAFLLTFMSVQNIQPKTRDLLGRLRCWTVTKVSIATRPRPAVLMKCSQSELLLISTLRAIRTRTELMESS